MNYRLIILALLALLLVTSAVVFLFGRKPDTTTEAKLTFWGLDSPSAWLSIIQAYKTKNPKVAVNYVQKSSAAYEKDLLDALASGSGPDIAYIKNTWLNKHLGKFSAAPDSLISPTSFRDVFVDAAVSDLIRENKIYAVPFYADTLALYFNKSLFNNAGIASPPATWDEFNADVAKITQKTGGGEIGRAGAALGTASNVSYASDILGLLMLQTGAVMVDTSKNEAVFDKSVNLGGRSYSPGLAALDFYTNFSNSARPFYTWNARMPKSLDIFAQGRVGMYIGYAKDLPTIQKSAVNYGVSAVPQVKDTRNDSSYLDINFANYAAGAVTKASAAKTAAWDFLVFATSRNASNSYLTSVKLPTARKDLVDIQKNDMIMGVFAKQGLSAVSWPQPDDAEVAKIFNRMIDSVALGQAESKEAIKNAVVEINNLLK